METGKASKTLYGAVRGNHGAAALVFRSRHILHKEAAKQTAWSAPESRPLQCSRRHTGIPTGQRGFAPASDRRPSSVWCTTWSYPMRLRTLAPRLGS